MHGSSAERATEISPFQTSLFLYRGRYLRGDSVQATAVSSPSCTRNRVRFVFRVCMGSARRAFFRHTMLRLAISSISATAAAAKAGGRMMPLRQFGTSPKEQAMEERLRKALETVTACEVTDVSGGCGSFFKVKVVSPRFEGMTLVQRNRLVYAALQDEIGEMHGLNVECKTQE